MSLDEVTAEIQDLEQEIRACLPQGWQLEFMAFDVTRIPGEVAPVRCAYLWTSPVNGVHGGAHGADRLAAVQATLAELRSSFVRPGDPGALGARVVIEPLELPSLPADWQSVDVRADDTWAAIAGDPAMLITSGGVRCSVDDRWPDVSWMRDQLVTVEGDLWSRRVVVRGADGSPTAEWPSPADIVVGAGWVAAADTGDDPDDDRLQRLVVWNPDGSTRRAWSRVIEDPSLSSLRPDGLVLVGWNLDDATDWAMLLFDTIESRPRQVPMPSAWDHFAFNGPPVTSLGHDRFALVQMDAIWAWRAGDVAMTLVHEGPLVVNGHETEPHPRRWLSDGRVAVHADDQWWVVTIEEGLAPAGAAAS